MAPKIHLLALCGTDIKLSRPDADGWFISDFYLFHHLFANTKDSVDKWLTSCAPHDLLQRHEVFLHGNPWQDRRVVLSKDHPLPTNITVVEHSSLKKAFLSEVEKTFAIAHQSKAKVMLVFVGHGVDGGAFVIGDEENVKAKIEPEEVEKILAKFPGLTVNVLLTSCYSGAWCSPAMTVLAAAGAQTKSISWGEKVGSVSERRCGGIYASAVTEQLLKEEDVVEKAKDKSFLDLVRGIKIKLAWLDRFHDEHGITFSAQENQILEPWRKLINLPLSEFTSRFHALPIHPAPDPPKYELSDRSYHSEDYLEELDAFVSHVNSSRDHVVSLRGGASGHAGQLSPSSITDDDFFSHMASPYRILTASARIRAGPSMSAVRRQVRSAAKEYLTSGPGPDNLSPNTSLHTVVRKVLSEKTMEDDELEAVFDKLLYRLELNQKAENLLKALKIDPVCSFDDFDDNKFNLVASQPTLATANRSVTKSVLFPEPGPGQGQDYDKPKRYFTASLLDMGLRGPAFDSKVNDAVKHDKAIVSEMVASIRSATQVKFDALPVANRGQSISRGFSEYLTIHLASTYRVTKRAISPVKDPLVKGLSRLSLSRSKKDKSKGKGKAEN
ncbi:hypothetical protein D6D08_05285 [Aureobasidium pullulans]|nr:hypothetical protein D6D08_05285 [Aureobasidium pullulans]